ncbi:MAG: alpha/beta hydrolase fold domain-containing protein [Acidimicrobiia bacterium]|nr:alpha/beta hydrolase [Acidimicrobiia bacterium]MBT8217572.1 alpha/beta hydrolase [Acidimicrobiia bacterium]NNF11065.1 alpha/beta hydrolase fold domain-containing protein [Acidimicrobiia bacterium]NNL69560.1 alpha/beta hydrolase fold domain-containing protein [Acidimicrobiia bacterium]
MTTVRGRLANQLVRLLGIKQRLIRLAEVDDDPAAFRHRLRKLRRADRRRPSWTVRRRWDIEPVDVSGFDLFVMSRQGSPGRRVLLYLHGGGYLFGPFWTEWGAMSRVADRSDSDFAMLLYPRAPEHDAEAALGVAGAAYDSLADRYGAGNVLPIGTSAGGGLAIALTAVLRDNGRELPRCAVLLSPGVDMTLEQPVGHLEASDVLLSTAHVRSAGRVYAGALEPAHPRVSPLFGNLAGLPTMHVFVGAAELLRPSIEEFAHRATESGSDVRLIVGEDQQHTWPLAPTPEGRHALEQLVDIVASC